METLPLINEKDILTGLINGSEKCFELIYNHYSERLYYKLLKLVRSDTLACDILQDVFLSLWRCRSQIDIEKSFRSYLFRIVTNKTYDVFRKTAKETKLKLELSTTSQTPFVSPEDDMNRKETAVILSQAIELLPERRRQVFKLCKIDGKSYHDISQKLGISVSTISDHIVKANLFIRQQVVNQDSPTTSLV